MTGTRVVLRLAPALILLAIMLAGSLPLAVGSSQSIVITTVQDPSIIGVFSGFDTNRFLEVNPLAVSSGSGLSVVSGYALQQMEDEEKPMGSSHYFPAPPPQSSN